MGKEEKAKKDTLRKAPFVVISLFIVLWAIGIATGESGFVLEQAKRICLSCIGIG